MCLKMVKNIKIKFVKIRKLIFLLYVKINKIPIEAFSAQNMWAENEGWPNYIHSEKFVCVSTACSIEEFAGLQQVT